MTAETLLPTRALSETHTHRLSGFSSSPIYKPRSDDHQHKRDREFAKPATAAIAAIADDEHEITAALRPVLGRAVMRKCNGKHSRAPGTLSSPVGDAPVELKNFDFAMDRKDLILLMHTASVAVGP